MRTEKNSFGKRLKSMLKVDTRRMFTTPLFYIMVGICLVVPILILVMTNMNTGGGSMDHHSSHGMTHIEDSFSSEDYDTDDSEMSMQGFENTWEIIGSVSGDSAEGGEAAMSMDMLSMCNINLLYFAVAVLVCIFVADDFRSGYAKNLFTVRAKKGDYVISKSIICTIAGAFMILAFFVGTMVGGAVAGLSFDTGIAGTSGVVMCLISKMLLMGVFVPIYLLMGVIGKQKLWMSILGSCMVGMFLFMMIPMLTPLNSTIMNVILCLAGSAIFTVGFGIVSKKVLEKTSLV